MDRSVIWTWACILSPYLFGGFDLFVYLLEVSFIFSLLSVLITIVLFSTCHLFVISITISYLVELMVFDTFSLFFYPSSFLSIFVPLSSNLGHAFHAWWFNLGFLIYIFLNFHHETFPDLIISILFLLGLSFIFILILRGK